MYEVRVKLPQILRYQWQTAAKRRGLSLTSFILATVSEALLRTNELGLSAASPSSPASLVSEGDDLAAYLRDSHLWDEDDDEPEPPRPSLFEGQPPPVMPLRSDFDEDDDDLFNVGD